MDNETSYVRNIVAIIDMMKEYKLPYRLLIMKAGDLCKVKKSKNILTMESIYIKNEPNYKKII